jgi:hypothetical protein
MASLRQADVRQPRRRIDQQCFDAAKALALMLAQHQAGEQLGLGELLRRVLVGVERKAGVANRQGFKQHLPR